MKEDDYNQLLDHAFAELPEDAKKRDRFEVPQMEVMNEGNKTILTNFKSIVEKLGREQKHLLKFIAGEVGTAGVPDQSGRATLTGVFSKRVIRQSVEDYVKEFVLCKTCNKPDTVIEKQGRQTILVCHACGSRHSVRKI